MENYNGLGKESTNSMLMVIGMEEIQCCLRAMKGQGNVEVELHSFLNSALDGGE
jgi:hypothetical protein